MILPFTSSFCLPRIRQTLVAILLAALIPGLLSGTLLIASCEAAAALHAPIPPDRSSFQEQREATPKILCRLAALPALPVTAEVPFHAVARHVRRRPETVKFRSVSPRRRKHRPKSGGSPLHDPLHA